MVKVAISYGHGQNTFPDTGSKGVIVGGVRYAEHTHNAEVGKRVTAILRVHGVEVFELQPAFGTDVPLKTRTDQANSWGADLYYSIHANAGTPAARGWCGFYWGSSSKGMLIAQLYAAEMKALGLPMYSGDGIYPSLSGTWSDFHELRESHMVALLTENGFMTNEEDFKHIFLNVDGSWDKQAVAHAKTVLKYFNIAYKAPVQEEVKPVANVGIGILKVLNNTVIRKESVYTAEIMGSVKPDESYVVHDYNNGWFNIGGWVHSLQVHFTPHPETKITR